MATSVTYNLTGAVEFPFPYNVRTKDELVLSLSAGGVVPPASYDVVGMGPNSLQVTVLYPTAPTDGTQTLMISREVAAAKVSDFTSDRAVTAAALNAEFDNVYRVVVDNSQSLGFDAPVVFSAGLSVFALQTTVIYNNSLYYALATFTTTATFVPAQWQLITSLASLIQGSLLQELVCSVPYPPPPVAPVFNFVAAHSIDVANTFPMWRGYALTPAASSTVLVMQINTAQIGTVTFPAGANAAVFAATGSPPPRFQLNAGDRFTIRGPSISDPSLAGIGLTMPFYLVGLP